MENFTPFTSFVLQGGALAVMAIYFLWVNPRQQKEERESRERISHEDREGRREMIGVFLDALRAEREQCHDDHTIMSAKLDKIIAEVSR